MKVTRIRAPSIKGVCRNRKGREPTEAAQIVKIAKTIVYGSSAHLPTQFRAEPTTLRKLKSHSRESSGREPKNRTCLEELGGKDQRLCYASGNPLAD
jgi:hypothetical protein